MLGIYTRLSVEDGASNSIKNQLFEGKAFAKKNGLSYQVYNEGEGISGGAEIKDRPQLFRLLQDINDKTITSVWFRSQQRLERSSDTWYIFTSEAKKHNVSVYFNDKLFDFSNPQDNLFGNMQSALNQYQRDLQSAQTKKALRGRLERGETVGTLQFGYKSDNNKLVIDEVTAPIVREIFNKSLSGTGTEPIAQWLISEGVPTKNKGTWQHTTINKIIKNPIYKGVRTYGGVDYSSPIIIDEALWDKTNEHLQIMRQYTGKPTHHKYLLSNILKCGKCGSKVSGRISHRYKKDKTIEYTHSSYACISSRNKETNCKKPTIKLDKLDDLIWAKFVMDNSLSKLIVSHFKTTKNNDNLTALKGDLKSLESSKKKLLKDKDKLIQLVLDGVLSNEDTKSKMDAIKSSIKDTDTKILNAKEQMQSYEGSLNDLDSILSDLSIDQEYSFNDKQEILRKYVKDITLYYLDDHHYIDISFTIPNMDNATYVIDKGYNYAYRLMSYEELKMLSDDANESNLDGAYYDNEAFLWNSEYKELNEWLTLDVIAKSMRLFIIAKYDEEAILKAIDNQTKLIEIIKTVK